MKSPVTRNSHKRALRPASLASFEMINSVLNIDDQTGQVDVELASQALLYAYSHLLSHIDTCSAE
jgi:hypothetical protein